MECFETVLEKDFTFTFEVYGIKADGGDDVINIDADSLVEAEIIIESFHDGSYRFLYCTSNFTGNFVDFL